MTSLTSIRTSGDNIEIVNQLLLPHVVEFLPITTIDEAHDAIKTMKVCLLRFFVQRSILLIAYNQIRGAPAIASLAALSVSSYLSSVLKASSEESFLSSVSALQYHVQPLLDHLFTARPTAVNLGTALKRLSNVLQTGVAEGKNARDVAELVIREGRLVADEDVGRNKAMARWGAEWLLAKSNEPSGKLNVLTVCNTGSLATSVSADKSF